MMLTGYRHHAALAVAATLICGTAVALPVIPGAVGFGTDTPAGRGGEVIRVTNLNDSGPGSLRACVEASGPRYCIFEVSGVISLKENLTVSNPNVTIAGQTAPSPGIMLRDAALKITTSDVLVQHLASRTGGVGTDTALNEPLKINGIGTEPIENIVIDHCSLSWAIDENISTYKLWDNLTISNTIASEPLNEVVYRDKPNSYGALIDTTNSDSKVSLIGNLFAHSRARNPRVNAATFVFVKNVVYNAGNATMMLYNRYDIKSNNAIVGNVFISGPNTSGAPVRLSGPEDGAGWNGILPGTRVYLANNFAPGATSDPWSIVENRSDVSRVLLEALDPITLLGELRFLPQSTTTQDSVVESVLERAGARPGDRDDVDLRIIEDVRNGTGQIINCVADDGTARCAKNAGGWPELAENYRKLEVPPEPGADDDGDGYTNMEEWLHVMAAEVEGASAGSSDPDPSLPDEPAPTPPKPPQLQEN